MPPPPSRSCSKRCAPRCRPSECSAPATPSRPSVTATAAARSSRCATCGACGIFAPAATAPRLLCARAVRAPPIARQRCLPHSFCTRPLSSHAAGATFTDVIRHLSGSGFALPNLPSLPHVTVAGAIATGTHGSGIRPGMEAMITSFVLDITFVTHDGRCESASAALPSAPVAAHALRPQPRHVLPRR